MRSGTVGQYLAILTPKQENAVLTERLARAPRVVRDDGCRCLVGVTEDWRVVDYGYGARAWPRDAELCDKQRSGRFENVGNLFDELCERFGEGRINNAIRNRIFANQARRLGLHGPVRQVVTA